MTTGKTPVQPEPPHRPSTLELVLEQLLRDASPPWIFATPTLILAAPLTFAAIAGPAPGGPGALLLGIAAIVRARRGR